MFLSSAGVIPHHFPAGRVISTGSVRDLYPPPPPPGPKGNPLLPPPVHSQQSSDVIRFRQHIRGRENTGGSHVRKVVSIDGWKQFVSLRLQQFRYSLSRAQFPRTILDSHRDYNLTRLRPQ